MSTGPAPRAGQRADPTAGPSHDPQRSTTEKAREQTRGMAAEARERALHKGDSQTQKAAHTLRQWADDLADMADKGRQDAPARKVVAQAADGGRRAADTLEERGFSGMAEGLQSFARRQPTAFLGGAALAGLLVGRLAKAGMKASHDGHASGSTGESASAERATSTSREDRGPQAMGYGEAESPPYQPPYRDYRG